MKRPFSTVIESPPLSSLCPLQSLSRIARKHCQPCQSNPYSFAISSAGRCRTLWTTQHQATDARPLRPSNRIHNRITTINSPNGTMLASGRPRSVPPPESNKRTTMTIRTFTSSTMYSNEVPPLSHTEKFSKRIEPPLSKMHYAIALGSNLGDRMAWIEKACREMDEAGIHVKWTSSLWETVPMYVEDQANFLNGVCVVETAYMPGDLLFQIQAIENKLGRVKVIDKGPRNIDLDILLWERGAYQSASPDLTIPHKLMLEREFVIRPLCELLPTSRYPYMSEKPLTTYKLDRPYSKMLGKFAQKYREAKPAKRPAPMHTLTPLSPFLPALSPQIEGKKTHVMAILNLTPDSFSDGGKHVYDDPEYLRSTILSHVYAGGTIIDLGGQSSRPNAKDVSPEEEITRIMPALNIMRDLRKDSSTPPFAISIDTYRSSVAEAAVLRGGADIINDISGGTLDPNMLPTIARLGCTYILMHMRGTPATMTSKENTTYGSSPSDVNLLSHVQAEMVSRLVAAMESGIRRWRIILDPGIGFAKTASQNLVLLRKLETLISQGPHRRHAYFHGGLENIPWLVGTSRKGFVGKVTGVSKPEDRVLGTAATVTACVAKGVDIVRVHDVPEMMEVVRMSEAIYRGWIDPNEEKKEILRDGKTARKSVNVPEKENNDKKEPQIRRWIGRKSAEKYTREMNLEKHIKNLKDEASEFDVVGLDGIGIKVTDTKSD